jgi:hypothetical protein
MNLAGGNAKRESEISVQNGRVYAIALFEANKPLSALDQ